MLAFQFSHCNLTPKYSLPSWSKDTIFCASGYLTIMPTIQPSYLTRFASQCTNVKITLFVLIIVSQIPSFQVHCSDIKTELTTVIALCSASLYLSPLLPSRFKISWSQSCCNLKCVVCISLVSTTFFKLDSLLTKLGSQGNTPWQLQEFSTNMVSWNHYFQKFSSAIADLIIGDVVRIAPNEIVFITPKAATGWYPSSVLSTIRNFTEEP